MSYEYDDWNDIRKKGLLNYIFFTGVLHYGSVLFISLLIVNHSTKYGELVAVFNSFDILVFLDTFFICVVAGIFYGYLSWWYQERKRMAKQKK